MTEVRPTVLRTPPRKTGAAELEFGWHGSTLVVRCVDEASGDLPRSYRRSALGHALALVSAAAAVHDGLGRAIVSGLRAALREGDLRALWLAPEGPPPAGGWRPVIERVLADIDIDVMVPVGGLAGAPATGFYAGASDGSGGWFRHCQDGPPTLISKRFPVPSWEHTVPTGTLGAPGVIAEPVPAGLVVRSLGGPELAGEHRAFQVPIDPVRPRLIVDSGLVRPGQVADLLRALPPVVVVPSDAMVAGLGWMSYVAEQCDQPIVFTAGLPVTDEPGVVSVVSGAGTNRWFRPFGTVLRQRPGSIRQEVVEIAPAPDGWQRAGAAQYRFDGCVADVVPGGLTLREESAAPNGNTAPFDPNGWTLTLGVPGAAVTDALVAALGWLLTGAGADRLRTMRLIVAGGVGGPARYRILSVLADAGIADEQLSFDDAGEDSVAAEAEAEERTAVIGFPQMRRGFGNQPPKSPPARPEPPRAMPVPPAVVSVPLPEPPAPMPVPQMPVPPMPVHPIPVAQMPVAQMAVPPMAVPPMPVSSMPLPPAPDVAAPMALITESAGSAGQPVLMESGPGPEQPAAATPSVTEPPAAPLEPAAVEEPVSARAEAWPEKSSTSGQQTRFTAEAGNAFTDGLSLVNAAQAAWPALRRGDSGEKADYVAVCVYLTRGPAGGIALNRALRAGQSPPLETHPPCLVSGLGRLPVQRRVVVRQLTTTPGWAVGTVLTDPGFVSASVGHDVSVDGAAADLLLLPSSARRTSELVGHRQIDEAVFLPGRRFRILAVRTAERPDEDDDGPTMPATAYLARELPPGGEGDDKAALDKLDKAWQQRQRRKPLVIDDPDIVLRLTMPMVVA